MNPDRKSVYTGIALTLVVMFFVFRITVSQSVYAPGARELQQYLAVTGPFDVPFMKTYAFGHFVFVTIRKIYGTATFTIVAFGLSMLFARPVRLRNTIVLMTILRASQEVFERLLHRHDSLQESLFDTLTGTLAGYLGALAYNALAKRDETT